MVIGYLNRCVSASSLGILAEIKVIGESSLVFSCLWTGFIQLTLQENTRLGHRRRTGLKIFKFSSLILDIIL
jgi:hypothetical protein